MTLTLPTIYPAGYQGTATDFKACKADRSGALRMVEYVVAIPSGTTTALVGLVPFNKGCRIHIIGSSVQANTALDTGTSIAVSVGYTYYDSTLGTSSGTAFVSSATTWQSSALTALTLLNAPATVGQVKTTADGWITLTCSSGTTSTTGNVFGSFMISYDQDPSV